MFLFKILLTVLIATQNAIINASDANNYYNKTSLSEELLKGYNRFTRPVRSDQTTINVTFDISLYRLAGFDVKEETITTLLWQRMDWRDEIIQWDPKQNDNVTLLRFEMNDVWTPDIFPFNDVATYDPNMYEDTIPVKIRLVQIIVGFSDTFNILAFLET